MKARFQWVWVWLATALLALLASESSASAQPAPNCDQIQAQIAELEKQPGAAAVAKQQLTAAASTVVRARDARAAGDVEHGIELEALAADYLTTARTVVRAAALEARLRAQQTKQTELETALRHTETLLEATIAQRERAKAALQQSLALKHTQKATETKKATVVKVEQSRVQKGAKK